MASYYLYESQAEKLRGLKTPATQELARAVERYLSGEFTSCLAFTDKNTENLTKIPKAEYQSITDSRLLTMRLCARYLLAIGRYLTHA